MRFASLGKAVGLAALALACVASPALAQEGKAKPSTGIVLIAHGRFAIEAKAAAEMVVGRQDNVVSLSVDPTDKILERRETLIEAIKSVDEGCGVIVMTDLFGGTPSNLALSAMVPGKVEVLSGLNIPMLVKGMSMAGNCRLDEAVTSAKLAGQKYINLASEILKSAPPDEGDGDAGSEAAPPVAPSPPSMEP